MTRTTVSSEATSSGKQTEMHRRIEEFAWAATSIGPRASWPQTLTSTIEILLGSRYPMILLWGPELIQIYNDAYIKLIGDKHPDALGRPIRATQAESWEIIGPIIHEVMSTGLPNWVAAQCVLLDRAGYREESYFSLSCSALDDDHGAVCGMLCVCSEVTEQVLGERRLKLLRDLGLHAGETHSVRITCQNAASVIGDHALDVPFAFLYLPDSGGRALVLASSTGAPLGRPPPLPLRIELDANDDTSRALERAFAGERTELALPASSGVRGGPWGEPVEHALCIPLSGSAQGAISGVLVAGRSPNRALDENYASFYELLGNQVALAIRNARAYEHERKRAEALVELDRAKTTFFSNVSHEFRTPLTLMLGPLDDMLRTPEGRPDRSSLELVHRNALRLLRLVNSLLDFSRIEAGRMQSSFEPTDLALFTADLASSFRSLVERAGLEFAVSCPPLSASVYVDRAQWEKVVSNLLSNAFKFTFAGRIALTLQEDTAQVRLVVEDTGTGIADSEQPRVFERFHRVLGTRGRSYEGAGIGLALVAEIVRLHGGSVSLESEEGRGSKFTVTLPMGSAHLPQSQVVPGRALTLGERAPSAHVLEAAQWLSPVDTQASGNPDPASIVQAGLLPPVRGGQSNARVLIADDNSDLREYLVRLLGTHWRVEAVSDGAQALASARREPPDLVLSDVMMPGLGGFGLLRELRRDPRTSTVPVILLSARAGEEAVVAGLETGADDYLVKPFSALELLTRVRTQLEMASMRRAVAEEQERARATAMLRFLADASSTLAESLDYATTLARTARLAVPILADWCLIDIVREGGKVERVEVAHADPAEAAVAQAIKAFPAGTTDNLENPPTRALRQGRPVLLESVDDAQLHAIAHSENHVAVMRALGLRSFMAVPLAARGRILGTLSLALSKSGRRYGKAELAVAEDLARRCALAVDNAWLYAEAQRAVSARDQFLSNASHELKTPLTPLQLQLHTLERRVGDVARDERTRDWLKSKILVLQRQSMRLDRLVNELLDVTHIAGERLRFTPELVDLSELACGVVALFERSGELQQSHCEIELDAEPNVSGYWDRHHLEQVLIHLLDNALKFGPGKPVELRLCQRDSWVELTIRDHGVGIAREDQARIFERFERAVTERYYGGLGLGLWLVRSMVEAMGGRVTVRSAPDQGATFVVELPTGASKPEQRKSA